MVRGLRAFDEKERRRQRRQNHIARDLRTPKYRQRRVEKNKEGKYKVDYDNYDFD